MVAVSASLASRYDHDLMVGCVKSTAGKAGLLRVSGSVMEVTGVAPKDMSIVLTFLPGPEIGGFGSERGHYPACSFYGLLNVVVGQGGTGEAGLEGGWRQVDALLEHALEELLEALRITGHHLVEAGNGGCIGKEETEHGASTLYRQGNAGAVRRFLEPVTNGIGFFGQPVVETRF